jgi:hypothetical protein
MFLFDEENLILDNTFMNTEKEVQTSLNQKVFFMAYGVCMAYAKLV